MEGFDSPNGASIYSQYSLIWPEVVPKTIIKLLRQRCLRYGDSAVLKDRFGLMLDVACGNGQSTVPFSPYFDNIIASDISEEQIKKAKIIGKSENIRYLVAPGHKMQAEDNSVDLITCAGAVHYLELDKFTSECNRVLRRSGCIALYAHIISDITTVIKGIEMESGFELFQDVFLNPLKVFIEKVGHPTKCYIDEYSQIYDKINDMNKERGQDIIFERRYSLKYFKEFVLMCPYVRLYTESLDFKPLDVFGEAVKKMWCVPDVVDEDICLNVKFKIFMLILTKFDQ